MQKIKVPAMTAVCIFFLIGLVAYIQFGTITYVTVTVTGKDRVVEKQGDVVSSKYLIFTEHEVFQNTDNMLFGKFNSSDIYASLAEGETYKFKVNGYRLGLTSAYRNILEVQSLTDVRSK